MGAEIVRFGDFELDRGAYQLRRAGQVVHLQRIPLDLLFLMVEQRGQMVTHQEIVERIWGKGVFLDSDNSINAAVRKLRRALKDNPRELAAMQRFALGAFEQALTLARSALDLLESLTEGLERTRQQIRWQRSFSLALAISRGHEGEEALAAFHRLAELSRRAGNSVELMEALKHIGIHHKARGELRKARDASEEHLALAQRAGHRFQEASARLDLGEVLMYLGELYLARENLEKAEAYCDSAPVASNKPEPGYTSFKPWNLRARDYIAPLLDWYFGLADRARKGSEGPVVVSQEVDSTVLLMLCGMPARCTLYAESRKPSRST